MSNKHHYIPKCYLKGWNGADGLLCEYQVFGQKVVARRCHRSETGWSDRLYSVDALPPEKVDWIEKTWFLRVDQDASDALDALRAGRDLDTKRLRDGWSRFIMSLIHRYPGKVAELWAKSRQEFERNVIENEAARALAIQEGIADFDAYLAERAEGMIGELFARTVKNACDLPRIGEALNNMPGHVVTVPAGVPRLMTSDRPLYMSTGVGQPDCLIMLPLSPWQLLVASNSEEIAEKVIDDMATGLPVTFMNNHVTTQATRFVYAVCEDRVDFVREIKVGG